MSSSAKPDKSIKGFFGGLFKRKESSVTAPPPPMPVVAAPKPVAAPANVSRSASSGACLSPQDDDDNDDGSPCPSNVLAEFEFVKELGKGATAVVKLCRRKVHDNQKDDLVAMKEFKTSLLKKMKEFKREGRRMIVSTAFDKVQIEIAIMKKLSHANLVSLEAVLDDGDEQLVLVLEYAPHGQIMVWDAAQLSYVPSIDARSFSAPAPTTPIVQLAKNGLPLHVARKCFRELLIGLEYLHTNDICHRDLKPENILVGNQGTVKIADFGVAHFFDDTAPAAQPVAHGYLTNSAGTYAYMAPESMASEPYSAFVADIWALGITLYAMLFGTLPYFSTEVTELFDMIQNNPIALPTAVQAHPELSSLLLGLLEKNPAKRLTIQEMKRHPWVNRGYESQREDFQCRQIETVEVSADDIQNAFTRIPSMAALTRMKISSNKWANNARKAVKEKELLKQASSASSNAGDTKPDATKTA
ncbi:CAMKK protein kinase [Saprolegnia parasitica CBS 223.65]|uniref:CAMKK protein kinase n=1 Tax=Saprolegnia parasitica (strain CBS 223.65) TaxID=695850 RepID=A0A067CZ74_SAPPC|nr:CAMKK protein kinase [Saprolegnia parasitica CBS 223.65]KDO35778.1 CAMKK protein kinase [Saprolegnia parasitica CBS 223.65]|eukprot:XP_012194123.1 CAMKK protein kinase [Saprolegnia parasitica CBS 223.65]